MMRAMHGELEQCKSCLHCPTIYADMENRLWTVCDLDRCIYAPKTPKRREWQ